MSENIKRCLDLANLITKKSVFLFGPRQTGKSTLINTELSETFALSWNLLKGKLRLEVQRNPSYLTEQVEFLNLHDCAIFIDEIQLCPELLNECHLLIQERNIRFMLTGSSARKLRTLGTNLLGGRAWERHLHPFTYSEVGESSNYNLSYIFEHGLLPSMFFSNDIEEDLSSYVGTYLTEEIAAEGTARNLGSFSRFLKTAALTNGQLLNFANIAADSQVPVQTIKQWYKILEDTLLGFMIEPYKSGTKRKTVATSKFYLFDIGVARTLQNIQVPQEGNKEFGDYFEQLVCMELKAWIDYKRPQSSLTFWRTTTGNEVDFCVDDELAIEVKSTDSVNEKHLKGLQTLREENIFKRYILVCREDYPRLVDGIEILPWKYFFKTLWN